MAYFKRAEFWHRTGSHAIFFLADHSPGPEFVCVFRQDAGRSLPWCTTPIEAESSLGPDSHHPVISLSGIPSAVMVFRILHPIFASTLCAANPLARIAEPTIAL